MAEKTSRMAPGPRNRYHARNPVGRKRGSEFPHRPSDDLLALGCGGAGDSYCCAGRSLIRSRDVRGALRLPGHKPLVRDGGLCGVAGSPRGIIGHIGRAVIAPSRFGLELNSCVGGELRGGCATVGRLDRYPLYGFGTSAVGRVTLVKKASYLALFSWMFSMTPLTTLRVTPL